MFLYLIEYSVSFGGEQFESGELPEEGPGFGLGMVNNRFRIPELFEFRLGKLSIRIVNC